MEESINAWFFEEKWSVRVLRYGMIHGFARHEDKEQAIKEARENCDNRSRLLLRLLKQQYEAF